MCNGFLFYMSAVCLGPDVGKLANEWFVVDVNAIVDRSGVTDRIRVLGDFNLPKIGWGLQENGVGFMPVNVTTDLESNLRKGLLSCDLGQINAIPNQYGRFLDLIKGRSTVSDLFKNSSFVLKSC
jgi:hypothetical protein